MFAAASNSTGLVLTLPANYLYVGLVGVGTFWVNLFQASQVGKYRKLVSSAQSSCGKPVCARKY